MPLRIGLVGYGVGGRLFHAPFIEASPAWELVGVVARSPERVADVSRDLPGMPIHGTLAELVAGGVDAVTISTPPATRRDLVLEAIAADVHVIADKPFAPDAQGADVLASAAEHAGVVLNVFHNRRFDTDIVTAQGVLRDGVLGDIRRLDLRCDQNDPETLEAGPHGGLLRDLGSHVVDQAILLLGPVVSVAAQLDHVELRSGVTDVGFTLALTHSSGSHSHVSATKLGRINSRELRVFGSEGSYRSDYSDVQVEAIRRGERPAGNRNAWGFEREERWGVLATSAGRSRRPSLQGDYTTYYDRFADAVTTGTPGPAPAREGIRVLQVLDAARTSARDSRTVEIA